MLWGVEDKSLIQSTAFINYINYNIERVYIPVYLYPYTYTYIPVYLYLYVPIWNFYVTSI